MKTIVQTVLAAAIALPALVAGTAAQANIKEMKFHQVNNAFEDVPYMNMEFKNGKWVWTSQSKSFNTRIKIYFKASRKVHAAHVILSDTGMTLWQLPAGYETKKFEQLHTASLGKTTLTKLQGKAAAVCDVFGGSQKVVHDMELPMMMAISENAPGDSAQKNGKFVVRAVCQAKPNNPQRVPTELKVSQIKLYTIPAQPQCGKPVHLVTEIWTTKPGDVPFVLERHDGASQNASVTTTKVNGGYVKRWSKEYTFKESTDRRYRIVARNQAIASQWVPIKLTCHSGPGGLTN
ncbi:MAG: hypothetical protein KDJ80_05920 [Nitratireductor sp.]|nr:hypothetical protein [Nitratireductor sp.]